MLLSLASKEQKLAFDSAASDGDIGPKYPAKAGLFVYTSYMNKTYIVAAIGLVVVAAGAYMAFGKADSVPAGEDMAASSTPSTLRELAASRVSQKCDFTSANETIGTVYVADGRVRSDFTSTAAGKPIVGHALVLDNTAYAWMDGMSQGFKNSFDATTTANSQGVNPDERVSYSCEPWVADAGLFSVPADIQFMSVTDIQVKAGAGAMGASCGQCAQIPDATAKAQCLAALHC